MTRVLPSLEGHDVRVLTTDPYVREQRPDLRVRVVNDANEQRKGALLLQALRVAVAVAVERPRVVISTGASVGYFALRVGKMLGARTIWVDSIANVERVSKSGMLARGCADLWLTQWEHLAAPDGPEFAGTVLG